MNDDYSAIANEDQPYDECECLKVREVAKLLHTSEPFIRRLMQRGELPSVVIGRCRRVRRSVLEAFLAHNTEYRWRSLKGRAQRAALPPGESFGPDEPAPPSDVAEGDDIPY